MNPEFAPQHSLGISRPIALALVVAMVATVGALHIGSSAAAVGAEPATASAPYSVAEQQALLFADAVEAFRNRRYADAYGRFARLADAGDPASARIALVMLREGPALFGSDWGATPGQQQRWNAMVVNDRRQRVEILDDEHGD